MLHINYDYEKTVQVQIWETTLILNGQSPPIRTARLNDYTNQKKLVILLLIKKKELVPKVERW